MLEVALKSFVPLGVAWLAAVVLRRRSAAAREQVWLAALAVALALPVLVATMPPVAVPVATGIRMVNAAFQATVFAGQGRAAIGAPPVTAAPGGAERPLDWSGWPLWLWVAGAASGLARLLAAWTALRRMRGGARWLDSAEVAEMRLTLGIREDVELLESRVAMPITCGLLRPAIMLPVEARAWSSDRRRAVLLHELAHVRRKDVARQLAACFALCLYWWNPLAWIAWRRSLDERERAADDLVLAAGARASEYADHLLAIARAVARRPEISLAGIALAPKSGLESRLAAILDRGRRRSQAGPWTAAAAVALALLLTAPIAALRAQQSTAIPDDVDAFMRAAAAQKNYESLESMAAAAQNERRFDVARKALESSVALRRKARADEGLGLLKLAEFERTRGNLAAAAPIYERAVPLLANRPEAATALIGRGLGALARESIREATASFEAARAAGGVERARAAMWLGVVQQRLGFKQQAEVSYREAVGTASPQSEEAYVTRELLADFLDREGRGPEAAAMREDAAARRGFTGPPGPRRRRQRRTYSKRAAASFGRGWSPGWNRPTPTRRGWRSIKAPSS